LADVSSNIWKTSKEFDLDANKDDSPFDRMVDANVVQKTLEDDTLLFIEGQRPLAQPDFMTTAEFDEEIQKKENWDVISAGDYQEEFDEMFEEIDNREKPKIGFFDKKEYFEKVFPPLKIQKPGYDLYGSSTICLTLMALFVFLFYNNITVDPSVFPFLKGQSSIFGGEMSLVMLTIIAIIILERYTNRTDTKASNQKRNLKDLDGDSGFFNQDEMFKRASTQRSMTVKLKTMATSDLDMQGNAA